MTHESAKVPSCLYPALQRQSDTFELPSELTELCGQGAQAQADACE